MNVKTNDKLKNTFFKYQDVIKRCKSIFINKHCDYGASWHILRLPSFTDQIYIKASRIRAIQEKSSQLVSDSLDGDFIGIINYCIMALIKHDYLKNSYNATSLEDAPIMYDKVIEKNNLLLTNKNHDYDEAWRKMRLDSIVDIILAKLLRIKHIEDNHDKLNLSEGVDSNYRDIINYAVFCLIKLDEQSSL